MLDDYWLEILPEQYIGELGYTTEDGFDCYLKIYESYQLNLGPLVLDGYYVIFDQDNNQVMIAPQANGARDKLTEWDGGYLMPLQGMGGNDFDFSIFKLAVYALGMGLWYYLFTINAFPEPNSKYVP